MLEMRVCLQHNTSTCSRKAPETNIAEAIPNHKSGETSSTHYSLLGSPESGSALGQAPRLSWLHHG